MAGEKANEIDRYIAAQAADAVEGLQKLRQIILSVAPQAKQKISYQMPAFEFHGMLVGFAAWKNHYGFYPWNSTTVQEFAEELKGYETSKGAIQFPKNKPLPVTLIKKIVKARMADNLAKEIAKKEKRKKKK